MDLAQTARAQTPAPERPDGPPAGRAYAIVGVLICASILSFLDRTILSLMVDSIRASLDLTDTHIGILSGFAFALFYALMGVPLGRWADKHNRALLIVAGVCVWSFATAMCGLAQNFHSLFVARMLVGVGEAALAPAALSIIADIFPRRRVGFALALLGTGITFGNGVAIWLGGLLLHATQTAGLDLPWGGSLEGWRLVFVITGACGIPVAGLIATVVREPPRSSPHAAAPSLREVASHVRSHVDAYGLIVIGYALMVIMSLGQLLWGPAHFARVHHMAPENFATFYGPLMGVGGTAGLLFGGFMSDRLTRRGVPAAPSRVILISIIVQAPLLIGGYLCASTPIALALYGAGVVVLAVNGGLQTATLQRFTPSRMLGSISAIYLVFANIIGGGLGPFVVGATSNALSPQGSELGTALAIVGAVTLPVSALLVLLALRPVARAEHQFA